MHKFCEQQKKKFNLKNNLLLEKCSLDTQEMKIFYHEQFLHKNIQWWIFSKLQYQYIAGYSSY